MRLVITIVVLIVIVALVHYFLYAKKATVTPGLPAGLQPGVTPNSQASGTAVAVDNLPTHYTPIPTSNSSPTDLMLSNNLSELENISDSDIGQLLAIFDSNKII